MVVHVCNTKFAKIQFWSALHITFLASSERVNKCHPLIFAKRINIQILQGNSTVRD